MSGGEWSPKVGDRVRVTCDYGPYARKGDVGVVETVCEDQCYVQLGHHHGRWWIRYALLEPEPQDKKENIVQGLDLSKPCEVRLGGKWERVVGVPVFNGKTDDPRYGCYYESEKGVLRHSWTCIDRIRNVREPQYEPHTMMTLLPLVNEWVYMRGEEATILPFGKVTWDEVEIDRIIRTYKTLKERWLWATGPHKGKPVAREVV